MVGLVQYLIWLCVDVLHSCPGYPNRNAANVALRTVRSWLDESENANKVETMSTLCSNCFLYFL